MPTLTTDASPLVSTQRTPSPDGKGGNKEPQVTVRPRTSSSSSSLSLKTPRTTRFAEATSVNSPIGPTLAGRNPFCGPPITTTHLTPQAQPSDIGFGYMSQSDREKHNSIEVPLTPMSPMRSALKVPGTPGRFIDPRSPTFKEETVLEEQELKTDKQNAADLVDRDVRSTLFIQLTIGLESQNESPYGEGGSKSNKF
ncbi:MAG: hypothetical protein Q9187_001591 [Circinaria calcarea]